MSTSWRWGGRSLWLAICLLIEPRSQLPFDQAVAALGSYRPFVSRLTVEMPYATCRLDRPAAAASCKGALPGALTPAQWQCSPPPHSGSTAARALATARARVLSGSRREAASTSVLHRTAILELLLQPDERGIAEVERLLRRALMTATDRGTILSDLGAVELARAQRKGSAEALVQAIEYSQQAITEGAQGGVARFNLALALSELGLVEEARKEWHRLLMREPNGAWAAEARQRLAALPPADGEARGQAIALQLSVALAHGDRTSLLALARIDRQRTREWVENDLLARWAKAKAAHDEPAAATALDGARVLAAEVSALTGDRLLADSVSAILRGTTAQVTQLVRGHAAYAEGVPLLQKRQLDAAAERFSAAETALTGGESPFALWATFQRALVFQYLQRPDAAEAVLAKLTREAEGRGYSALKGRIHWVRGLATSLLGRVEESNEHYRTAAVTFCQADEPQNLAITQALLGAGLAKLSHHEAAWTLTASALSRRSNIFYLGRLQAILQDAVFHAQRQGMLRAGLHLANEHVVVALREGAADDVHNALMRRAALREAVGQSAAASFDVDRAVAALASLSNAVLVDRSAADRIIEQARGQRPNASAAAVERLDRAIKTYQAGHNLQKLPEAHALRAEARLGLGDVVGAEKDLIEQARLLEATLFTMAPGPLRQDRVATLRDSFDQMVDFQASARGNAAAAFRFAEQMRHWALWEWAGGLAARSRGSAVVADPLAIAGWADLQAMGSGDTAVLVYHALPSHLLIWVAARGTATLVTVPVGRDELTSRTAALLTAATDRASTALSLSTDVLSAALIAPVAARLDGSSRLVIVPDRSLQDLPFGLLRGPRRRFLYEDHALVFAPSVTAYARLARAALAGKREIQHLVAVAATAGRSPTLSRLPGAAPEAAAVAAAWPGGEAVSFQQLGPLRRRLQLADAFHFAGHALVGTDGSLRLIVHDDRTRSAQLIASTLLDNGGSQLRLVTLSGCRTVDVAGAGRIGASSAGFVRSFLAAGVPTVVGSFLDLDDRQASAVFTAFHQRVAAGQDPAMALRQACLDRAPRGSAERALLCGGLAVFGLSTPITR
jgi:CHAT domain-containing protein